MDPSIQLTSHISDLPHSVQRQSPNSVLHRLLKKNTATVIIAACASLTESYGIWWLSAKSARNPRLHTHYSFLPWKQKSPWRGSVGSIRHLQAPTVTEQPIIRVINFGRSTLMFLANTPVFRAPLLSPPFSVAAQTPTAEFLILHLKFCQSFVTVVSLILVRLEVVAHNVID
jgi:hypothetical protein